METDYQRIRKAVEQTLLSGKRNFIIYPYGEYGMIAKQILNDSFGIKENYIIDNKLAQFNPGIYNLDFCRELDRDRYTVLFTCANPDVYDEVLDNLKKYFAEDQIVEIFDYGSDEKDSDEKEDVSRWPSSWGTKCGKYSYGPLCDHWLIESVGAFCSFVMGTDALDNHAIGYISTHPFLYFGGEEDDIHRRTWEVVRAQKARGYFEAVKPKGENYKLKKITIGNDVWLGQNVLITNGSNIGNGVIAGAGAIITKDVPDYAVVMGVPARIVRYRYKQEEIDALNRIAWWDWSDERIIENYDDFYLDIREFIRKYDVNLE